MDYADMMDALYEMIGYFVNCADNAAEGSKAHAKFKRYCDVLDACLRMLVIEMAEEDDLK